AISGNTVTISPGLNMPNWKAANSPQAWWFGGTLEMSGLEDLTVSNVAGARNNVSFENARNCWMKNVNSYNAREVHLRTYIAANIEARHSYFFGTVNAASRNRLSGWEPNKIASTFSVAAQYMNHYANVVGNILGQSGYHDTYECANGGCNTAKAIYYLGYYDTSGSTANYDSVVPNTI